MTSSAETTGQPITHSRSSPVALTDRHSARRRWEVWRSPEDQPEWARPALLALAAFAAALYSWNIAASGYATFYSDSVKSMSVSWKALLFGAMDPGATITEDKIPGSFAIQAISARIFGFHQWSVTLPQCVEGVIAVLIMYRVVRRWAGPAAGLLASAVFTFTPVLASMFGHPMEDGALTMCLVLAADRFQVAVQQGRLRSLIWAGFWVGAGFQMKMMQAWMVLPALALAYLLVAPGRVRRRVGHVLVAGAVCLAVSMTWVVMMTVVPAKDRPYVDGSTNNSAIAMVLGYNGLERFGIHIPGALPALQGISMGGTGGEPQRTGEGTAPGAGGSMPSMPGSAPGGGSGTTGASTPPGGSGFPGGSGGGKGAFTGMPGGGSFSGSGSKWTKLFSGRFAAQISWVLPFALLMLALGLYRRRRAERTDVLRGGFVMWGGWLVVVGLVFSDMGSIPHTAYMATLAPPLAALCGAGLVALWRAYRRGGRAAWVPPVAVAGQAAWTWYLWSDYSGFLAWLRWLTLLGAVAGTVVLVLGRLSSHTQTRVSTTGLIVGLATVFVAPVAWSASAFDRNDDGSAFDATAGPSALGSTGPGMPGGAASRAAVAFGAGSSGSGGGLGMTAPTSLTDGERKLWNYVKARQDGAEYPLATIGWRQAEPYILMTGEKVLPIGGFSGSVPQPALGEFTGLVHQGKLHFVLAEAIGGAMAMSGADGSGSSTAITNWVKAHCVAVASSDYGVSAVGGSAAPPGGTGLGAMGGGTGSLYRCDATS